MPKNFIEETIELLKKDFKCINPDCDNNGSIPVRDSEGEWEQQQCEYCFVKRFPVIDFLSQKLSEQSKKIVEVIEKERWDEEQIPEITDEVLAEIMGSKYDNFRGGYNKALDTILSSLQSAGLINKEN